MDVSVVVEVVVGSVVVVVVVCSEKRKSQVPSVYARYQHVKIHYNLIVKFNSI